MPQKWTETAALKATCAVGWIILTAPLAIEAGGQRGGEGSGEPGLGAGGLHALLLVPSCDVESPERSCGGDATSGRLDQIVENLLSMGPRIDAGGVNVALMHERAGMPCPGRGGRHWLKRLCCTLTIALVRW